MWHASWISFGITVNTFSTDSTQVGIFLKVNKIGLACLLQNTNSWTLGWQICFEVLSSFSHQMPDGEFAGQKIRELRMASDFVGCNSTRSATMSFLHPFNRGCTLVSSFCSQVLPGCFTTGEFVDSLLYTNHGMGTSFLTPLSIS